MSDFAFVFTRGVFLNNIGWLLLSAKTATGTGKNLCWILLFNKVEGLQVCNCIKKRLQHRCFPLNIAGFLKTSILKTICEPPVFTCLTRFTPMFFFYILLETPEHCGFCDDSWGYEKETFAWNGLYYCNRNSTKNEVFH